MSHSSSPEQQTVSLYRYWNNLSTVCCCCCCFFCFADSIPWTTLSSVFLVSVGRGEKKGRTIVWHHENQGEQRPSSPSLSTSSPHSSIQSFSLFLPLSASFSTFLCLHLRLTHFLSVSWNGWGWGGVICVCSLVCVFVWSPDSVVHIDLPLCPPTVTVMALSQETSSASVFSLSLD